MTRLRPAWLSGVSTGLGLVIVTLAAVAAGKVMQDVTEGDGVAVLDRPCWAAGQCGRRPHG